MVPDVFLEDTLHLDPAGRVQALVTLVVARLVERRGVEGDAVYFEQRPYLAVDEVDPPEPVMPTDIDLPIEGIFSSFSQDVVEAELQAASCDDRGRCPWSNGLG
ncbi:MAG: hypothetical protein JO367_12420 [Actinobacteria bacterium]|nr:hypothetical protein [Actinomycetota bacterium]